MAANDEVVVHIRGDDSGLTGALRRSNAALNASSKQWKRDFGELEKIAKRSAIAVAAIGTASAAIATKALREAAKDSQALELQLNKLSDSWGNLFAAIGRGIAGDSGIETLADAIQRLADTIDKNKDKFDTFRRFVSAVTGIGTRFTGFTPKGLTGPELTQAQSDFQLTKNPHLPALVVDVRDQVKNAPKLREEARRLAELQAQVMAKVARENDERIQAIIAGRAPRGESISRMTAVETLPVSGISLSSIAPVGRGVTPINARRSQSFRTGGPDLSAAALFAIQAAGSGDPIGSLLSSGASLGASLGGPAGVGIAAAATLFSKILGSSRDREDEMYRAHARALREARDQTPQIILNFPAGALYNTSDPDFQEAIMETIQQATGNRVGRVVLSRS